MVVHYKHTPVVDGRRPLISAVRDGPQWGDAVWAFMKTVPCAASRSIWGVFVFGCPPMKPTQSFKSSMEIIRTFGGTTFTGALPP